MRASATTAQCGMELQADCHLPAVEAGWWTDLKTGATLTTPRGDVPRVNVPEKLCLIHSEVSEAMEGYRKGLKDDKLTHRDMLEVELADAVIRCFDLAGGLGYSLGHAISEKLAYNAIRADHKLDHRRAEGGKKF